MCEQPEVKGHGIQNSSLVGAADMGLQNAHSRLLIYASFKVCFLLKLWWELWNDVVVCNSPDLQICHQKLCVHYVIRRASLHSCCFFIGRFKHGVQSSVWQVQKIMFILL